MLPTIKRLTSTNDSLSLFPGTKVQEPSWVIANNNALSGSLTTFTMVNLIVDFESSD